MRGAHPNMRMHHPGAHGQQPAGSDYTSSKSIVTLALPMYTVGIGIFFIYTCCKVCKHSIGRIGIDRYEFSIGQRRIRMKPNRKNVI